MKKIKHIPTQMIYELPELTDKSLLEVFQSIINKREVEEKNGKYFLFIPGSTPLENIVSGLYLCYCDTPEVMQYIVNQFVVVE